MVKFIPHESSRSIIESAMISRFDFINKKVGIYDISPFLAKIIRK